MTRRERQKRNKLVAECLEEANLVLKQKEERSFPLRNNLGIIDPVPQEVLFRLHHKRLSSN